MRANERGISKPLIIVILVAVAGIIAAAAYFILAKPVDSNTQKALSAINTMEKSAQETIPPALDALSKPGSVTPKTVAEFKTKVYEYTTTLASFEELEAIKRSPSALFEFNAHKSELFEYGESLIGLLISMDTYIATAEACGILADTVPEINTSKDFDKASADCQKALSENKPRQDAFYEQFLTSYIEDLRALITATKQFYVAAETNDESKIAIAQSSISAANTKLKAAMDKQLTYTYQPPTTNVFANLRAALK